MSGLNQTVLDVAASLDDEHVAASTTDGNKILLFRTKTTTRMEQYVGHSDLITALHFNYNRKSLLSASKDHTIRSWDIATAKHTAAQCPTRINSLDLSWQETIAVSTHMKEMRFWSMASGTAQLM